MNIKDSVMWRMQKTYRVLKYPFQALPGIELQEIVPTDVEIAPPILEDVCMPPYVGWSTHDDLTPLLKIAKSLQPAFIVELGTAYGNSTANLCRQSPQAKVFTVNAPVEEQTGEITTYELTRAEIGRVYRAYGFSEQVTQIFVNTLNLDLSQYLTGAVVDLALIDACHDTDYVINDFMKIRDYMKPGGVVLFHDTFPSLTPSHLDGSYRACLKLRRQGYDIRHLRNTWWAVWRNDGSSKVQQGK
jgi:predicted O-methyltransferase YrrM